jgi:hypothetical protein
MSEASELSQALFEDLRLCVGEGIVRRLKDGQVIQRQGN